MQFLNIATEENEKQHFSECLFGLKDKAPPDQSTQLSNIFSFEAINEIIID